MRAALLVIGTFLGNACSGGAATSPTQPTTAAAAEPWAARGAVHDTIGRPIAEARVEVQSGPQRGLTVVSDEQGRFEFAPVFTSSFRAQATKAGYRAHTLDILRPPNPGWFRLESVNASIDFTGDYMMTFTADSACASIPGYARRRSYDVTNTARGPSSYLVSVAGGQYGAPASEGGYFNNVLYAGSFEDIFALSLSDPPLWERFPQGSYLVIAGQADGSVGEFPARLSLNGWFVYCPELTPGNEPRCAVSEVRCQSSNHQLTIARR
jgi:hypothetical protein